MSERRRDRLGMMAELCEIFSEMGLAREPRGAAETAAAGWDAEDKELLRILSGRPPASAPGAPNDPASRILASKAIPVVP